MTTEETSVAQRMKEIHERRDEIRRQSEERAKQGLTPFPTVEEVRQHQHIVRPDVQTPYDAAWLEAEERLQQELEELQ
jgi:hypothetical protein